MRQALLLPLFLLISWLPAIGGILIRPDDWYQNLIKPPGTPPSWVFGPVWTIIYLLIGLAGWRAWTRAGDDRQRCFALYTLQLLLNAAWTPVFFGLHQMGFGLLVLLFLDVAVLLTLLCFRRRDRWAAWLLVPYLLWICYATWLNAGLWWLNHA